jgi:hypothetical protein
LGDADMIIKPTDKTVYGETFEAVVRVENDPEELEKLILQREHYKRKGLGDLKVYGFQPLIRRHSPEMERFNEAWWAELCRWSYRDQVSFPVIKQMFPNIKFKEMQMGDLYCKLYGHANETYPKISPRCT